MEGVGVPGALVGDSRAQIESSWGPPSSCQGPTRSFCTFPVAGGGAAFVSYLAAGGGAAALGDPSDEVAAIRWSEPVDGWVTTDGINTTVALADPAAVQAAYPKANVITNPTFGAIVAIEDPNIGLLVEYPFDYLSGTTSVMMGVRAPYSVPDDEPEPDPEPLIVMTVDSISLSAQGNRLTADVLVEDTSRQAVPGALVRATWPRPTGATVTTAETTDRQGVATFDIRRKGSYSIAIDDVQASGFQFDPSLGVTSASTP